MNFSILPPIAPQSVSSPSAKATQPTPEWRQLHAALRWMNSKNLGYTFRDNRHRYEFSLNGNVLEIREYNSRRLYRESVVELTRLREVHLSMISVDGICASTATLKGGSRSVAHLMGDRRKIQSTVDLWIDEDLELINRVSQVLALAGNLAAKADSSREGASTNAPAVLIIPELDYTLATA